MADNAAKNNNVTTATSRIPNTVLVPFENMACSIPNPHPIQSGENWDRKDAGGGLRRPGERSVQARRAKPSTATERAASTRQMKPESNFQASKFPHPPFERPFRGAIAWKSQGRRDQRERWSPQGFHISNGAEVCPGRKEFEYVRERETQRRRRHPRWT